jgi:uncharacterized protein (TIGR03032 family)
MAAAATKENRCHLNGLAMEDGESLYVTGGKQVGHHFDGWRHRRLDGGIVVEVRSGEMVLGGMPHSPRIYRDKLWVLNSGSGDLGWVEFGTGGKESKFHVLAFCPRHQRDIWPNYARPARRTR